MTALDDTETLRLFGSDPNSIVDGPGLRYALFVQGCSHACPGCHNPESWNPDGGVETPLEAITADIYANGLVQGVTISGGEPFDQAAGCARLARQLKEHGYNLWVYSGYTYEELLEAAAADTAQAAAYAALLDAADVLVDGPYRRDERSLDLKWRGSANQRLIDLARTRQAGHIVEWTQDEFVVSPPASW